MKFTYDDTFSVKDMAAPVLDEYPTHFSTREFIQRRGTALTYRKKEKMRKILLGLIISSGHVPSSLAGLLLKEADQPIGTSHQARHLISRNPLKVVPTRLLCAYIIRSI